MFNSAGKNVNKNDDDADYENDNFEKLSPKVKLF